MTCEDLNLGNIEYINDSLKYKSVARFNNKIIGVYRTGYLSVLDQL